MGVYLLQCDEQQAKYIWNSWLNSPSNSTKRVKSARFQYQLRKMGPVIFLIISLLFVLLLCKGIILDILNGLRPLWSSQSILNFANPFWFILFVCMTGVSFRVLQSNIVAEEPIIISIDPENNKHVVFSVQLKPSVASRAIFIICLLVSLIYFEEIIFALPDLVQQMLPPFPLSYLLPSLIPILLPLLVCISGLSPLFLLGYGGIILRKRENTFKNFMGRLYDVDNYDDVFPLAPPRNWVLFPKDTFLIQGAISVLFFVQLLNWFDPSKILLILSPYLLILGGLVLVTLAREYAYRKIVNTRHIHSYWKLEMARLAGSISYFFIFPLLFYLIITLLTLACFTIPSQILETIFSDIDIYNRTHTFIGDLSIVHYKYLQFIFDTGFVLIMVFLLIYIFILRNFISFNSTQSHYDTWKKIRNEIPQTLSLKSVNTVIMLDWSLKFIIGIVGIGVISLCILWAYNIHIKWLPSNLTLPFVYYQEMFRSLWGNTSGDLVSHILILGLFAPTMVWLGMWLFSLI